MSCLNKKIRQLVKFNENKFNRPKKPFWVIELLSCWFVQCYLHIWYQDQCDRMQSNYSPANHQSKYVWTNTDDQKCSDKATMDQKSTCEWSVANVRN